MDCYNAFLPVRDPFDLEEIEKWPADIGAGQGCWEEFTLEFSFLCGAQVAEITKDWVESLLIDPGWIPARIEVFRQGF